MMEVLKSPLQAAACNLALLLLLLVQCSLLQCFVGADQVRHKVCPKTLWRIDFNNSFRQGEAALRFNIPYQDKGGGLYEAIVECDGLTIMNSTGHQFLRVMKDSKNIVEFGIKAPLPRDPDLAEEYGKDTNHSCTFELRHETMAATRGSRAHIECQFTDVVTTDTNCETGNIFGHNRTQKLEEELFSLNLPGLYSSTIVLEFNPACDNFNETMRRRYYTQQMADCYYEVFALCQEGMLSIKYEKVEFDEDVMYCHPPKSKFTKAMEHLELKFRIDSQPVVFLLLLLIINVALYVALIPFLIAKFANAIKRKYRQLEDWLGRHYRRYKQQPNSKGGAVTSLYYYDETHDHIYDEIPKQQSISMPGSSALKDAAIESNHSSELGMEYDDVEYVLLGKLSAKDLQGMVDSDLDPEEEAYVSMQFEVEADVEPVTEQPYVNIEQVEFEGEPTMRLKKRIKSPPKHQHKHHRHRHHHGHHHRHQKRDEDDSKSNTRERDGCRRHERPVAREDAKLISHSIPPLPARPLPPPPPPPVTPVPQTSPPTAPLPPPLIPMPQSRLPKAPI